MKRLIAVVMMLGLISVLIMQAADHSHINVVILGDSNTSIGGDSCNKVIGWSKWFKDVFAPASCRSYARSGSTWTNTVRTCRNETEYNELLGDNNVVYNQACRLISSYQAGNQVKPQLILIAAGTNDAWFGKQRPQRYAKTVDEVFANATEMITQKPVAQITTLAESVRYVCEMLMATFPDAQIVLLTPMQCTAAPAEDIRKVGDIIEQCGQRMSVNVIRQDYGSVVNRLRESIRHTYTSDGTHTNEQGARRNGAYIAHRVEAILQM